MSHDKKYFKPALEWCVKNYHLTDTADPPPEWWLMRMEEYKESAAADVEPISQCSESENGNGSLRGGSNAKRRS